MTCVTPPVGGSKDLHQINTPAFSLQYVSGSGRPLKLIPAAPLEMTHCTKPPRVHDLRHGRRPSNCKKPELIQEALKTVYVYTT